MYTELQRKIIEMAKSEIKDEPWFKGVCLDQMKHLTDSKINEIGIKTAAEELIIDTMSWDA